MYANCMKISTPNVSVIQDTRRSKINKLYPVKLRITFNRQQVYYTIGIDLSKDDFEIIQNQNEIKLIRNIIERRRLQEAKLKCDLLFAKAHEIINDLKAFSFQIFERKFLENQPTSGEFVFPYFQSIIDKLESDHRIGTASNYRCSLRSIESFKPNLKFSEVSVEFLKTYEKWLITNGKSISTVGIYLRPLRSVLNSAFSEGIISKEGNYPFGRGLYKIPATRNIKKALTKDEIKLIFNYNPAPESWWAKAKDFFIFSYLSNGMNMKDILLLRKKDIDGNYLRFVRSKTANTNRSNLKLISIFISPELKSIINKWESKGSKADDYLFPFLDRNMTPIQVKADVQQFVKMVNKYLGYITKEIGIEKKVTTYCARHSFATILKRRGVSTEIISESLGHSNINTTNNYLDSFDDDIKKEISEKLIDF